MIMALTKEQMDRIEKATVRLTNSHGRGQGVLVNNYIILTVAHLVEYDYTGGMVLGDYYGERIDTEMGTILGVSPDAVEPVADIAALGQPDGNELFDQAQLYWKFCEETEPIPLCLDFEELSKFPIFIFNKYENTWVSAVGEYGLKNQYMIIIKDPDKFISLGTSGGPIVNDAGELVGLLSNATGSPIPCKTLPIRTYAKIMGIDKHDLEKLFSRRPKDGIVNK
jgi:hypothetical protein